MPTKNFGKIPRPKLEIVGWDDNGTVNPEVSLGAAIPVQHTGKVVGKRDDMDDEIPF